MLVREGTHTCEYCGESYEWYILQLARGEVMTYRAPTYQPMSKNIEEIKIWNGRITASSRCQYCHKMQTAYLVDEEYSQ